MKNIHLLPTDKPSRLFYDISIDKLVLASTSEVSKWFENKNIYITNSEEIKEGDWILNPTNEVQNCIGLEKGIGTDNICWIRVKETTTLQQILNSDKIILTTDQSLDGVQAIDDEFLEWFIKNPSCEDVEVTYDKDVFPYGVEIAKGCGWYKIIIPKEEPIKEIELVNGFIPTSFFEKQETLEEAAEKWNEKQTKLEFGKPHNAPNRIKAFIEGAKWQQERMYSEEDLREAFKSGRMVENYKGEWEETYSDEMTSCKYEDFNKWFEQFKKK